VYSAVWQWVLKRARDKGISSDAVSHNYGTPVVGETADWWLNDVHRSMLEAANVEQAFHNALTQTEVLEGQNGGGAGMTCHMFPAGTGTSSRVVQAGKEGETYTVGVLLQSNYGRIYDFQVAGVPIGQILLKEGFMEEKNKIPSGKADDGSIVIILM
jgi:D-aminopeptidase